MRPEKKRSFEKIAIVGATGAVGRQMLQDLEELPNFDAELFLFASPRSAGEILHFHNKRIAVQAWSLEAAKDIDIFLMSAGGDFSKEYSPKLVEQGAIVIDNSSAWRMHKEVPLVVPEVNSSQLDTMQSGIIANPNCSTIQMVVPLAAIHQKLGLEMVAVSTYQSVSGSGQKGIAELSKQIKDRFNLNEINPQVYPQAISFNVLSSIGAIDPFGHCEEEKKMVLETRKILGLEDLAVHATTARVPTINCHCESVLVKCKKSISLPELKKLFAAIPGVVYDPDLLPSDSPSPLLVAGKPQIYVSRIRLGHEQTKSAYFQFWVVADNLRKGAATNAVQILSYLWGTK
ncbi:MAG: aspartate-semialdehyde dehydrogenase [Bdellovibrionota bacterium]